MIRIGFCDDDTRELARIQELLSEYKQTRNQDFICQCFSSPEDLLEEMETCNFQIILLDVLMPGLNGIQTAQRIRQINQRVKLLFLSSSPEFAVDSYTVGAFHYLLKPIKSDIFFPILDKALEDTSLQDSSGLTIKGKTKIVHIPFSRMEFVDVMNKVVFFHLSDGSVVETFAALANYEQTLLERPEFVKVHRSYLVNLRYVETIDKGCITTRLSHQIPVARTLLGKTKETYIQFLFSEKKSATFTPPEEPAVSLHKEKGGYRILLVDGDCTSQHYWGSILKQHGCYVSYAKSGEEAQTLITQVSVDCIILETSLPDVDSFSLCHTLKEKTPAPIFFYSLSSDTDSQLKGYGAGCVDFISKNTSPPLFWSKVVAHLLLYRGKRTQLYFGTILLDAGEQKVSIKEIEIKLSPIEFHLLWILAEHVGEICSPCFLYESINNIQKVDSSQAIQVHLSRIRHSLEKVSPQHNYIETVWGEGYRFVLPEETDTTP